MDAANPWLPRRRAAGARLRLFCFPCAGGGSAGFHGLARALPPSIELLPLLLPGRERRLAEAPLREMGALLTALEAALDGELGAPCAFLGHSLGALVAFELARRLGPRGPLHLFACAARAPQRISIRAPIHALPDEAFVQAVKGWGGLPPQVLEEAELMEFVLPALRADFELYERYVCEPEPALELPLTVLGGAADIHVSAADLAAWGEHNRSTTELHTLPGGHFFLQESPALVAARVCAGLESILDPIRRP